jgi:Flp pilus assembly protein TadD
MVLVEKYLDKINQLLSFLKHKATALYNDSIYFIKNNREKLQNLTKANYELGLFHLENGNLNDAIFRFYIVYKLNPSHINALYNLGRSYLRKGNSSF